MEVNRDLCQDDNEEHLRIILFNSIIKGSTEQRIIKLIMEDKDPKEIVKTLLSEKVKL